MSDYDPERVSRAVAEALAGPGGVALVLGVFAGVAGVVHIPAQRGLFRSRPERILIGDWRYEMTNDGRLSAAHVVNGIVIAEETLAAAAVGPHVARAVGQVVTRYGATVVPHVEAAVEALNASTGR
ncbi:MAG: DUF5073 family protein [Mycobacteriaceae bacterium]|nr:DUF5073 family protein [Mycobacteriaceae bacterium]